MKCLIIFALIGIIIGALCGLVPGIHPNTAGALIVQILGQNQQSATIIIAVLGVYCAICFLPSMFLGIPEGNTQISLLPAQRMMKQNKTQEALTIVALSLCMSAVLAFVIISLFTETIIQIFTILKPYIGWILSAICILLLAREIQIKKIIYATAIFLLSAIFGFVALNSHMADPLYAMFVGFFAIPALLMHKDPQISCTKKDNKINLKDVNDYSLGFLPYIFVGTLLGAIADLLPGISSPAQLAVFSQIIHKKMQTRNFISQIAAIEASHCVFSIASASNMNIARVGAVAIANEACKFSEQNMIFFLAVFSIGLGVGSFFILNAGKKIERIMISLKFEKVARLLCIYLFILCFLLNGVYGILTMAIATLIGFLPIWLEVSRTHVMGSIIITSIMYTI